MNTSHASAAKAQNLSDMDLGEAPASKSIPKKRNRKQYNKRELIM